MNETSVSLPQPTRRGFITAAGAGACLLMMGCTPKGAGSGSASGSSSAGPRNVRFGTTVCEDFLPAWVAQRDDLFPADVVVDIETYKNGAELSEALAGDEIDMAMTDPQACATVAENGTPIRMCWIALGADPEQGRFGIMVGPDSTISAAGDLRGATIGVVSNSVPEYVMDELLADAGMHEGDVAKSEAEDPATCLEMVESGQVDAAVLPADLLALGESKGCRTIIDDMQGDNLSQSIVVAREDFWESKGGEAAVGAVQRGWDEGARLIDADPENYRDLLAEKVHVIEPIASTYELPSYPTGERPTKDMIQPQVDWMKSKGYLEKELVYEEQNGIFEE